MVTIEWDPDIKTLTGAVVGRGAVYNTAAFFASDGGGSLGLDDGECTCPVGYNCKHVAAIVIAATDGPAAGRLRGKQRPPLRVVEAEQSLSWEQPLRALIDAPAAQSAGNPMAIELALHAGGGPERRHAAAAGKVDAPRRARRLGQRLPELERAGLVARQERRVPRRSPGADPRAAMPSTTRARDGHTTATVITPTRRSISAAATACSCGRCWRRPTASA